MSKRSQRSKTKANDSNINFVFKPDESLNRDLSFSGSVPNSPAHSNTGFDPSGGSFGSNTSQPFTFGGNTTLPVGNPTFSFNAPPTVSSPSSLKRGASEIPMSGTPEHNTLRRTASEFSFGSTPSTFDTPSSSSPFTFGATNPTNTEAKKAETLAAGFSVKPSITPVSNTPTFAFTAANTSESTNQPAKPTPTFSFGSTNSAFGNTPTTSEATKTTINAPATQSTTSPPFTFGAPSEAPKTTPNAAFSFVKPSEPSSTASTPAFSFGKPAEATTSQSFSFGKPAEATSKPAASTFSFGKPAETTPKTSTPNFSFGKTPETKLSEPAKSTAEMNHASSSPFTFGTPASTPSTTAATTASTKPSTTFTFGSAPASTGTTTTSTFSFGSSSSSTTTSTTVPSFTFGADAKKDDGKKDDGNSAPLVTSSPFTFGSTTATSGTTNSSSTIAPPTTTAGITNPPVENKPNPFSFSKALEDLSKVPTQQPGQIYASLVTPSLSNLYQNHTVHNTGFRIDNISSSTRFTELPEQAQKELDTLEKYIRLEGQRSDHIRNHGAPQQLQKIETCKKDIESLSQKSDALSSMLKSRLESSQSLYDTIREQLRHANDGCAIIEACKHPGTSRRWLFGHSDEDDYFPLVAKELAVRMEEYKKSIWEIERTAESWSKNRAQSPQDIARIMHAQNQTFLVLANRVVFLHECVEREKEYYKQYLKTYT